MATTINQYASNTNKSPVARIIDNTVGNAVAGMPTNAQTVATSTAQSLLTSGSAINNLNTLTTQKTDNVIARGASEFMSIAAKVSSRATAADVAARRNNLSTHQYFTTVSPNAKVAQSTRNNETIRISVL